MTSFQPYDRRRGGIDLYSSGFGPRRVGQQILEGLGPRHMENSEYETLLLSPVSAPFARPRRAPLFTGLLYLQAAPKQSRKGKSK